MSNIAFLGRAETFPEADLFPLEVIGADGQFGRWFTDHAEVVVLSRENADNPRLAVAIKFPTIAQAQRAGQILSDAFAAVLAIEDELAIDQTVCGHDRIEWVHFDRMSVKWPVCPDCALVGESEVWPPPSDPDGRGAFDGTLMDGLEDEPPYPARELDAASTEPSCPGCGRPVSECQAEDVEDSFPPTLTDR